MFSLAHKVALVTGGGSGIGAAIARVFAEAGAYVIVADIQEAGAKTTTQQLLAAAATGAEALTLNVAEQRAVEQAAATVHQRHGRLDILVNNAGIGHVGTILQTKADDLDRLYQVNVRGVF